MTEPIEHILWGLQTRMEEIKKLAESPEDARWRIIREANGALLELRQAREQLREAKRALFDPEVSP